MITFYLFVTFIFLWLIGVSLFDRDWCCPAMLIISGYTLSVMVACVSDIYVPFEYHWMTYGVLVIGLLMYMLPAYIIKIESKTLLKGNNGLYERIEMSRSILWIHAILCLVVLFLTIEIYSSVLTKVGESTTFLATIAEMRKFGINNPEGLDLPQLSVINQIKKIFFATGYMFLVIFIRNCVIKPNLKNDKLLLFNCLCCFFLIMTGGGRGSLVAYLLSGVVIYFIYSQIFYGTGKIFFTVKNTFFLFASFVISSTVFYCGLWLTGRENGDFNILELIHHVSFYLGGSIPLFDNFLETYNIDSDVNFGKETFYAVIQQFRKIGLIDVPPYSIHLEFRPNVYDGNVYTAFRSYINDFGYIGILIFPIICSIVSSCLYYSAIRNARKEPISVLMTVYAIMVYPIFADFIRGFFLMSFFSFDLLIQVSTLLLFKLIIKKSTKK